MISKYGQYSSTPCEMRQDTEHPRGFDGRGSWRAGRPPDLFGWARAKPEREVPTSVVRGHGKGEMLNFRENLTLGEAGEPDALQTSSEGIEQYRGGNFQLLWYAVGRKGAMLNFCEGLMVAGAGGPVALQTSSPARRPSRAASFSACGPSGLTLPGCARQLLNRRSGSARLRSTASQSLLAALRSAKQFSHMRSRRSPRLCP